MELWVGLGLHVKAETVIVLHHSPRLLVVVLKWQGLPMCIAVMHGLDAAHVPKARRATKPTKGSQRRRVEGKVQRGQVKALRGKVGHGE